MEDSLTGCESSASPFTSLVSGKSHDRAEEVLERAGDSGRQEVEGGVEEGAEEGAVGEEGIKGGGVKERGAEEGVYGRTTGRDFLDATGYIDLTGLFLLGVVGLGEEGTGEEQLASLLASVGLKGDSC